VDGHTKWPHRHGYGSATTPWTQRKREAAYGFVALLIKRTGGGWLNEGALNSTGSYAVGEWIRTEL
jgi:hypothetical protein